MRWRWRTPARPAASKLAAPPDRAEATPGPRWSVSGRRAGPWSSGGWLALITFWLGVLWAVIILPLNAPDEPAHLHAIMQVRVLHILPEVHFDFSHQPAGEIVRTPLDPATTAYIAAAGFQFPPKREPNESWQPPLYYLTAGILTQVLPPDPRWILYGSRLISILFGVGMVYFCWAAMRELAPGAPLWALAAAAAVVLLPQAAAGRAVVANDTAVNCCTMAAFYVWFRGLRRPDYDQGMLRAGAVTGLAVMTSLSAALLLPGLALVALFRAGQEGRRGGQWLRRAVRLGGGAGAVVLAICLPWLVRNLVVYGDPTGTAGILRYAHATYLQGDLSSPRVQWTFTHWTWESFWGWFGWLDVRLPLLCYQVAGWIAVGLTALSSVAALRRLAAWRRHHRPLPPYVWQAALVMTLIMVELGGSYIQFSRTVAFQAQGRLLFPALLPGALIYTGGLHALIPGRFKVLALSIPLAWLAVMNMVGLALMLKAPIQP